MQFKRKVSLTNPGLILSHCLRCGAFVAASSRPDVLDIAERAHQCVEATQVGFNCAEWINDGREIYGQITRSKVGFEAVCCRKVENHMPGPDESRFPSFHGLGDKFHCPALEPPAKQGGIAFSQQLLPIRPFRRACSITSSPAVLFKRMRSLLCTLLGFSLWVPYASAQSAVLIGLHLDAHDGVYRQTPSSYRTYLITFRDGKARLAAELADLIVPRRGGFWRVGTLHKVPQGKYEGQEFIYAVPARAIPLAVGEYHPANPEWYCSETDQTTIEFVNRDLLSVSYFNAPACSFQVIYQHGTYRLDQLQEKLDITAVLGASAWDAEKRAYALAKPEDQQTADCIEISEPDPSNWGIVHSERLPESIAEPWGLVSDFNAPHVCGGGDTYQIKFPIPESLTGARYHRNILSSLLRSKTAKDNYILPGQALLSPAGDFLVAFGYSPPVRVFAVGPHGIKPEPLLSVPISPESNVVMVEWALGKDAADWESELQSLQKTRLPAPDVAVGNRQGSH